MFIPTFQQNIEKKNEFSKQMTQKKTKEKLKKENFGRK